jgi:hypothetical protein
MKSLDNLFNDIPDRDLILVLCFKTFMLLSYYVFDVTMFKNIVFLCLDL